MRITVYIILTAVLVGCSADDTSQTSESNTGDNEVQSGGDSDISSNANDEPSEPQESSNSTNETETTTMIVDQIQGRWVIEEANVSGQAMDAMKGTVAEISGNEITISVGGQQTKSTLKFNGDTSPIQFDALNEAGQAAKAILELDGEELTVNTSLTGAAYPESFEPGPGLMLVKYKRE